MEFIVNSEIIIKESIDELSHCIGELIIVELSSKPKLNIALSGGSTPKALFNYLSKNFALKIDWNKIHFFWGDERCVPPDDEQSNYKLANDFLFTRVNLPRENIYRIFGENDAEYEAERYSNIINEKVDSIFNLPSFDIVILGLGEDGHTASIFPNQMEILNSDNNCMVALHPISNQKRITLTGRVINNSKKILFLVSGKSKQKVVSEILNENGNFSAYPASYISPQNGRLTWLLDKQAAALLEKLDSTQN